MLNIWIYLEVEVSWCYIRYFGWYHVKKSTVCFPSSTTKEPQNMWKIFWVGNPARYLGGTWMLYHSLLPICGHVVLWISGHQSHFPRDRGSFCASKLFFDPRRLATARQSGCHEVGAASVQASSLSCFKQTKTGESKDATLVHQVAIFTSHSMFIHLLISVREMFFSGFFDAFFFHWGSRQASNRCHGNWRDSRPGPNVEWGRPSIPLGACVWWKYWLCFLCILLPRFYGYISSNILHVCACLLAVVVAGWLGLLGLGPAAITCEQCVQAPGFCVTCTVAACYWAGYCNSVFDFCSCFSSGLSCFSFFVRFLPLPALSVLSLLFLWCVPVFLSVCRLYMIVCFFCFSFSNSILLMFLVLRCFCYSCVFGAFSLFTFFFFMCCVS